MILRQRVSFSSKASLKINLHILMHRVPYAQRFQKMARLTGAPEMSMHVKESNKADKSYWDIRIVLGIIINITVRQEYYLYGSF